jgi:hypothetical protein
MKTVLFIAALAPLLAQQQTAPPQQPSQQPDATSGAAPPAPSNENRLTGSIDLGYRWQTGVAGSFDTYRSIVNLGSGPKVLGAEFTITDPKKHVFDRVRVRAYNWGDDPYSTFHLDAGKAKLYDFNADYRDIAYFNYLPSYADPLLARGLILNEQSFDQRRRFGSFQLDLLPGNWLIPYLAYDRDSGSGTGVSIFVSDANEFPVPNTLRDLTNLYRGGLRLELRRFHVTLEEGGTTFKDDQRVFQNSGSINFGNNLTPFLGHALDLTNLLGAYGIRGTSTYTKSLLTASAAPWLDLYGQFLFSQPESNVNYQQSAAGSLVLQSQLLFYTGQQYLLSSAAKMPHTTADFGAEIRPLKRVRIIESWLTDRLHENGSSASTQALTAANPKTSIAMLLASTLATNYNQNETQAWWDATSRLTLRGGYRRVWGDANDATLPTAGLTSSDRVELRRNVAIGGLTFRPSQKISVSGEVEDASSSGTYFRTSLYDYQRVRAQARYQVTGALSLAADFSLLNNQNPQPGIHYDYLAHQQSLSLLWRPGGGKRWDLQASYSRSTVYSDIGYLSPQNLQSQTSLYRDNTHSTTALLDVNLPSYSGLAPKLSAGGSFFLSSGSRPASYYQPVGRLWLPLTKNINWFTEWHYYGYGEAFYFYEGFRTHLVTTGLRFTR